MYTKGFEIVFSVNGSLIDDKNVHEGLKIKTFLKTSLSYFKNRFFCRLKKKYLKINEFWL